MLEIVVFYGCSEWKADEESGVNSRSRSPWRWERVVPPGSPSGARRWIVRATVKGQRNREGKPLRTDFGLGGADAVTLNEARDRAL